MLNLSLVCNTLFVCTDEVELVKLVSEQLVQDRKSLSDLEELFFWFDSRNNTPFHRVRQQKDTATTRKICEILCTNYIKIKLKKLTELIEYLEKQDSSHFKSKSIDCELVKKKPNFDTDEIQSKKKLKPMESNVTMENVVVEPKDISEGMKSPHNDTSFNDAWEVECTDSVMKFLSNPKTPKRQKEAVLKTVKKLASDGIPKNHKNHCKLHENIYKAAFSKGGRIIYEIAIAFSPRLQQPVGDTTGQRKQYYSEIIRLWEVVSDHDNVSRVTEKIIAAQKNGQATSIKIPLCKIPGDHETGKRVPQTFEPFDTPNPPKNPQDVAYFYPAVSPNQGEYNIVSFYSLEGENLLYCRDDRRDFPFKGWPKEHDIISKPHGEKSILLLGRSGTGKTTCCLYRMWNQFSNYWSQYWSNYMLSISDSRDVEVLEGYSNNVSDVEVVLEGCSDPKSTDSSENLCLDPRNLPSHGIGSTTKHLHQIFLTKNYVLCKQMKKKFYDLIAGKKILESHMRFEYADIPLNLSEVPDQAFPLFLTSRQFFLMLDNSLEDGKNFFPKNERNNLKEIMSADYDDDNSDTLSDSEDSDSDAEDDEKIDNESNFVATGVDNTKEKKYYHEITSIYFREKIWPKIASKVSLKNVKLDPFLVWMEIKSFIKGSLGAVKKGKGYLSLDEYREVGRKMAEHYADQREDIYKLFELYDKHVKEYRHEDNLFDESDLIRNIYTRLNCLDDLPWSIQSIYVDEVQDFTQAELAVLLRICRNPNDLFLTGDTAQSILRGVSFRFSDLRYLFYDAQKQVCKSKKKGIPKVVVPEVDELLINFRSHTGVLNLAASVIDVLKKFFYNSFDNLPRDEGMFPGPKPKVILSSNTSDLALIMRTNKRDSYKKIEFGARQVIIVQSKEAKQNLPDVLMSNNVLTVFESKGLEFDDVLLFDFFKYSQVRCSSINLTFLFIMVFIQVKDEWRIITAFFEDESTGGSMAVISKDNLFGKIHSMQFDKLQHKLLNYELKYLYTAITRARCNLWIYDSHEDKRRPVFDYWHKRDLVEVVKVDDVSMQESLCFSSTSTTKEWKLQGDYFKKNKLWEPAMKCYEKAECWHQYHETRAYHVVQKAKSFEQRNIAEVRELYLEAGVSFLESDKLVHSIDSLKKAANCLAKAERYEESAKLFFLLGKVSSYDSCNYVFIISFLQNHKALLKYVRRIKNIEERAEMYEKMGQFNDAIQILWNNGSIECLKKALEYASEHKGEVAEVYTEERIAHKCAKVFSKFIDINDIDSVDDFKSILKHLSASEQVDYYKSYKLYDEACEILVSEKKFADVFRLYRGLGYYDLGIELAESECKINEKITFLLFKCTKDANSNIKLMTDALNSDVQIEPEVKNRCMLVCGMKTNNPKMINSTRSYYIKKNYIGYLEVLNVASDKVKYDKDYHRWKDIHLNDNESFVTTILDACQRIEVIKKELQNAAGKSTPFIAYMENFYGLEKDHVGKYIVPESSYVWTDKLICSIPEFDRLERNLDSMIKIEPNVLIDAYIKHLNKLSRVWIIEDKFEFVLALILSLNRFTFHDEVVNHKGHLKTSCLTNLSKTANLQAYLETLSFLYDMQVLGNENIPINIIETVIKVLAPQATCYLQIPSIRIPTDASWSELPAKPLLLPSKELDKALYKAKEVTLTTSDDNFCLNEWLELWRIQYITNTGCKEMTKILNEKTKNLAPFAKNIPLCYVCLPDKTYQHIFQLWIKICNKFKNKKMYSACTDSIYYFFQHIASHQQLWEKLSISNLLNLVTVHSVIILTMLNICSVGTGQSGDVYIPTSYYHIVEFYLTMVGGGQFFKSSVVDIMKTAFSELRSNLTELIHRLLNIMIGYYNINYNPLHIAASTEESLKNHEAEHCLVLVLTLLLNLGQKNDFVNDHDLRYWWNQTCESIKNCSKQPIQEACATLSSSTTLSGCYKAIKNILEPSKDTLLHLHIIVTEKWNLDCKYKPAALTDLPQRRIISLDTDGVHDSFKLRATAAPFVPLSMRSDASLAQNDSQQNVVSPSLQVEFFRDDDETENVAFLPHEQDSTLNEAIVDDISDDMVEGPICLICRCSFYSGSSSQGEIEPASRRTQYLDHTNTESHKNNKRKYQEFTDELDSCKNLQMKKASKLFKTCYEQYEKNKRDEGLKNVSDDIVKMLKNFEDAELQARENANWSEGMSTLKSVCCLMEALTYKAEGVIQSSIENEKRLKLEEEVMQYSVESVPNEGQSDSSADISGTESNSGQVARERRRKKKKKSQKEKNFLATTEF